MLGQETGVVLAESFVCLITLDTQLTTSIFVGRRRTGLLLCHLGQMMFLE